MARKKTPKQLNITLALKTAQVFQLRVRNDLIDLQNKRALPPHDLDIGQAAFIFTNITFSLEMYLKCFLALLGINVPQTHNIWDIYNRIPKQEAHKLEAIFEDRYAKLREAGVGLTLEFQLKTKESGWPDEKQPRKMMSFRELLKQSANAYHSWRYISSTLSPQKQIADLKLHHAGIFTLCDILNEIMSEHLMLAQTQEATKK